MSKLRKVENESEARRYLARVEAAGVSLKAWAQAHGLDGRSAELLEGEPDQAEARLWKGGGGVGADAARGAGIRQYERARRGTRSGSARRR